MPNLFEKLFWLNGLSWKTHVFVKNYVLGSIAFFVREDLQALDQHYFSLTASIMIYLIILLHPLSSVYKFLEKNLICLNIKTHPSPLVNKHLPKITLKHIKTTFFLTKELQFYYYTYFKLQMLWLKSLWNKPPS